VAGERNVTPELIEEVSRALRVKPQHFAEYRLHEARTAFDPRDLGFDQALANLEEWAAQRQAHSDRGKKKRR
jgi:hypothetical protein